MKYLGSYIYIIIISFIHLCSPRPCFNKKSEKLVRDKLGLFLPLLSLMPFPLLHKTILVSPGKKASGKIVLRTGSSPGFQAQVWYLQPAAEPLRGDSSLTTACAEPRGTRTLLPPLPWHKTESINNTGGLCLGQQHQPCFPQPLVPAAPALRQQQPFPQRPPPTGSCSSARAPDRGLAH